MKHYITAIALLGLTLGGGASAAAETGTPVRQPRAVALEGDAAPAEIGGTYAAIRSGSSDDAGRVAFAAELADSSVASAIVVARGDASDVVARAGDDAPGGGRYASFEELDLGNADHLIFRARLEGTDAPEGVFLWRAGDVRALARSGDPSPRAGTLASFSSLTILSGENDGVAFYKLAFVASLTDGRKAVLMGAMHQEGLTENLATGDVFLIGATARREAVRAFTISRLGLSLCIVGTMQREDTSAIYKRVFLHDGFTIHTNALKQGSRYRRLGKLSDIHGPAAMSVQTGFVLLEFRRGGSALATWGLGSAHVFAKTGDVVEGVPEGERVERFEAPIANSFGGMSPEVPYGVVSVVTLTGGTKALLVGAFDGFLPTLQGSTRVLPLGAELAEFTPLKLSNAGDLLLSGRLASTGQRGLFVVDGLFEGFAGRS